MDKLQTELRKYDPTATVGKDIFTPPSVVLIAHVQLPKNNYFVNFMGETICIKINGTSYDLGELKAEEKYKGKYKYNLEQIVEVLKVEAERGKSFKEQFTFTNGVITGFKK